MFSACIFKPPISHVFNRTLFQIRPMCRNTVFTSLLKQCKKCPSSTHTSSFSSIASRFSPKIVFTSTKVANYLRQPQCLPKFGQCFRRSATDSVNGFGRFADIPQYAQKIVGVWLLGCAAMVYGAIVIGGITRLTESGLSMTKWKLLGSMPPRTAKDWEAEFEHYQQFPEYKYLNKNKGLTLSQFKSIYYMEYIHRMWGRAIGVFFALPAVYFWKKGWLTKSMRPRIAIFSGLILFQGLLGWYMVKSGLEDKEENHLTPRVSQFRLAAHMGSAVILYSLMLWSGLSHVMTPNQLPNIMKIAKLRRLTMATKLLVFLTTISGAFVAGLDAGLVYNSWPKMGDRWIPDDIAAHTPKWRNLFYNETTVQFNHRVISGVTIATILALWTMTRSAPVPQRVKLAAHSLLAMAMLQGALGVAALLTYVNTHVAASHQAGAVTLLSFAVWLSHELKRLPK